MVSRLVAMLAAGMDGSKRWCPTGPTRKQWDQQRKWLDFGNGNEFGITF